MVSYVGKGQRVRYGGIGTDVKPEGVSNGAEYFEIDTGLRYMYDAENNEWHLQRDTVSGGGGGTGVVNHNELGNRDKINQHPIHAITGLEDALTDKDLAIEQLNNDVEALNTEIEKPRHSTLFVEISEDGFGGFNAYHGYEKANDTLINNHRNADGIVVCYYRDVTHNVSYLYYYSNMESDRKPTFTRTYIENGLTKQVLISIDHNAKAYVTFRTANAAISEQGKITQHIDFDGYNLTGAQKMSTNGPAPLYIGSTIEKAPNNAPRITAAVDGSLAIVKADTVNQYVPVAVGDPVTADQAVTKRYLDNEHKTEMINYLKSSEGRQLIKDIVNDAI